jgi:maleamate amidohydrolase
MADPWDPYIPQETLDHYRRAGFARSSPLGKQPALLVIDVQYLTTGEAPQPLDEAIQYHPMNCGEAGWAAVHQIAKLVQAFRERKFPILYPYVLPRKKDGVHRRMPSSAQATARHWEIVEEVAPREGDIVIPKTGPSAFFGTPLVAHLNSLRVDTLFITGNTTSGCIRASTVDAYALNYKVVIPHECSYDRAPISHAVNLFDMASKYAEVVSTESAVRMLGTM